MGVKSMKNERNGVRNLKNRQNPKLARPCSRGRRRNSRARCGKEEKGRKSRRGVCGRELRVRGRELCVHDREQLRGHERKAPRGRHALCFLYGRAAPILRPRKPDSAEM